MTAFAGFSEAGRGAVLRFGLVGANPAAKITGSQRLPGQSNYMVGNDPRRWQTGVPHFGTVRYASVYPGTDLVYYGRQGQLEYDFVLAPGADPGRIAFSVAGAQRVAIDRSGDLVLSTAGGEVVQRRPVVYQQVGKRRKHVAGRYVLQGKGRVGFELGAYDRTRRLVIDPVLAYSSYLGGGGADEGRGVAVHSSGTYVVGTTASTDFPAANAAQATNGGGPSDAFVTKLNPSGSGLVYSTYLGGSGTDEGRAIAVDSAGAAYVTGRTTSGFPTTPNPIQAGNAGGASDAFVAKLNISGTLVYSTYLGGNAQDDGNGIAVDSAGAAYVTGTTFTSGAAFTSTFPNTPLAAKPFPSGRADAFVTKINASGSALVYSSFLGGTFPDYGYGIAVDSAGAAYATGNTGSPDFPVTPNAAQPDTGGVNGTSDAYVTKFSSSGSTFEYSTYLGGSTSDEGRGIGLDSSGNAYVTGSTYSTNFPTAGPLQPAMGGNGDAFVAKLNPGAGVGSSTLVYSTYLGGSAGDTGNAIAVDSAGSAHVTGSTWSANFPTARAVQPTHAGPDKPDTFVTKLNQSATALAYGTFLGGAGTDEGFGIALGPSDNAYVTGQTNSDEFPTATPRQAGRAGATDAFLTKIGPGADVSMTMTDAPDPVEAGQPLTYTLTIHNAGPDLAQAVSVRDQLPAGVTLLSASQGCTQAQASGVVTVTCSVGDLAKGASAQREITVRPNQAGTLSNTASVQSQTFDPLGANDSATASTVVSEPTARSADVSITKSDAPDPVQSGGDLTYTLRAQNAGPDPAEAVTLRDQLPSGVVFVPGSSSPDCSQAAGVVTCNIGALGAGDPAISREIAVRPTVPNPALSNTATVQSSTGDPLSSNNTATETTTVRAVADVSVTKRDFPDPAVAGEQLTYTLTATNTGPDVASAVSLRDRLPASVELVSASGCSVTDGVVSCNVGDLASGVSSSREVVVRPTEANAALSNTATVQTSAVDQDSSNDSATTSTEVREAPPLGGGAGMSPPVGAGPSAGGAVVDGSALPPARPVAPAVVAVSDQGISPARFAAAPSGPSALAAARKRARKPRAYGAKVSYRLNMAASVRFTVSQTVPGRRQGKGKSARCVAQSKQNRKAAQCKRSVALPGTFILAGKTGANSFRFTGRLANRKLKRGGYTLTATPTANAQTGKPARIAFTITR